MMDYRPILNALEQFWRVPLLSPTFILMVAFGLIYKMLRSDN